MGIWAEIFLTIGMFLVLMTAGFYIAVAMLIPALVYLYLVGGIGAFNSLGIVTWGTLNSFTLTSIPLFILMAEILGTSGLSDRVYVGLGKLVRWLPGGLLQTNIAGCAVFASVSGSSLTTAAAIGRVALPQLRARKYNMPLSTGSLAAGGTLGILIPPSLVMIVYSGFTQTSIPQLFMAGVAPGIFLSVLFMIYIAIRAIIDPSLAPKETVQLSGNDILTSFFDIVPFFVIIVGSLGSLYMGWVTTTEAATIGCLLAMVLGAIFGKLRFKELYTALNTTVLITASILLLVLSAFVFNAALGFGGFSERFNDFVQAMKLNKFEFFVAIFIMYIILGMFIESIPMILITVPLIFPLLPNYGIDPILFGILLVMFVELALITPPVGMNLFVIQAISGEPLGSVVKGTLPFCFVLLLAAIILVIWPDLALWLPRQMHQ